MNIIEQIELKNFRSFGNRKQESYKLTKCQALNIISGANDSGKSNILRALNLFFNKRTDLNSFLDFNRDFFKKEEIDENEIKEELITIKIWFNNPKNAGKNAEKKSNIYLPEKFWVSRKWKKTSEFSQFDQGSSIEKDFEIEKKDEIGNFIEDSESTTISLKSIVKASLLKQLTDFINSIQFQYVPAIKDSYYFSHLYGELQHTLWKTKISNVESRKNEFEKAIQTETDILMGQFKKSISSNSSIEPIFQLPYDLINLFRALVVKTGNVDLTLRGDGFQAKLIPEILHFIATKEQSFTINSIKKEYKAKKYFIWGFEEPENSYEYKNAYFLAERFKNTFCKNAQIFITTHSFNFLSLRGEEIGIYRVWKDNNTKGSKISKLKINQKGTIRFDNSNPSSEWENLQEELGFFYLNQELNEIYIEKQRHLEFIKTKALEINKPVIYSEGNNYKYLIKAKEIYANDIDIDIQDGGGKNDLHQFFKTLVKTGFSRYKTFFVFDCDAKKEFTSCKELKTLNIIPFIFDKNENNLIEETSSGIENLFNTEIIDLIEESKLFDIHETTRNGITISRTRILRKKVFEDFILFERNQDSDFCNFINLFGFIRSNLLNLNDL